MVEIVQKNLEHTNYVKHAKVRLLEKSIYAPFGGFAHHRKTPRPIIYLFERKLGAKAVKANQIK